MKILQRSPQVAAVLSVLVLAVACGVPTELQSGGRYNSSDGPHAVTSTAGSTSPEILDAQVPGLGRSAEAMLRDDAVAYWEAWTRDRATAACMEQAGFTWYPEVAYPEETVVAIAEMLGISRSDEVATRVAGAEGRNRQMYDALKPAARDRYARVLYGESAADLDYVIETGLVPRGRDDSFATGGCTGQSRERVGSIWDLKNVLGPELLDAEKVIKSTQFGDFRDEYEACASALGLNSVTGPDDIDRLLTASSSGDDGAPS